VLHCARLWRIRPWEHSQTGWSGSVQGIGFRYTAERIADSLKLTGWVRNLPDGRAEVIIEGSEPEIELFLQKINAIFKGYTWDVETQWSGDNREPGRWRA